MIDVIGEIEAVRRAVLATGESRTVTLSREYDAQIEDVWDAITNPERIRRWFLPVTGDLHQGGKYQLEGNAGGEIERCEPPRLLRVTWVFGDGPAARSAVEVRLSASAADATVLELDHTVLGDTEMWPKYGPGATGVGWDLTLLGLGLHLSGEAVSPEVWEASPQSRRFTTLSSEAWGAAHQASGASAEEAAATVRNTTAFYVPDPAS